MASFLQRRLGRPRIWSLASGVVFSLAATWPLSLRGGALYWGDVLLYFLPMYEYIRNELLQGRLPLWNPYVLGGQPLIGNPQCALFYPTIAALPMTNVNRFIALSAVFHTWLAWAGTYRYLRLLRLGRMSSILGACTFAGSSAFLARLQFPTMIQAMAWLPWILWAARRVAAKPDVGRALGLALVIALAILAAHPQMAYVALILSIATALAHVYRKTAPRAYKLRVAVAICASALLGSALSAAFWLPVLQTTAVSPRLNLSLGRASRFVLRPEHFITLIWPGYFGDPETGNYWAQGNMWEPALYLGVPQLFLAVLGLLQRRRDTRVLYHALLAGVCFWLALGAQGGLYAVAYYAIPGMSAFHDPARFCVPATLAIACLASIGFEHARRRLSVGTGAAIVVASVALTLLWSSRLTPVISAKELTYRARIAAIGSGHRVYSAMRQEHWDRYVSYADYGPGTGRYVHELTDTVSPNIGMRYDIEECGGYEPVPLFHATQLERLVRAAVTEKMPKVPQLVGMTDARILLIPLGFRYAQPPFLSMRSAGNRVYRLMYPHARAWVVDYVRPVANDARALAILGNPGFDGAHEAIIHAPVKDMPQALSAARAEDSHRRVEVRRVPNGCVLRLVPAAANRFVVISAAWMPGWKAWTDKRPARLLPCNVALMGVSVPPGVREVRLEYRPGAVVVGLYISFTALAVVIGCYRARATCRSLRRVRAR